MFDLKLILALLFLLLPVILNAAERKNRKQRRQDRPQSDGGRPLARGPKPENQGGSPTPPRTLSEWIEEIRQGAEERPAGTPPTIPKREAPQPRVEVHEIQEPARVEVGREPVAVSVHEPVSEPTVSHSVRAEEADRAAMAPRAVTSRTANAAHREGSRGRRSKLSLHRGDMKRAIVVNELISPPLAMRKRRR